MENLLLSRIDDRLIHGQVMTAWMKVRPAKQILVIDDKVAKDEFMIDVITLAAPKGIKVRVLSVDQATEELKRGLKSRRSCSPKGHRPISASLMAASKSRRSTSAVWA